MPFDNLSVNIVDLPAVETLELHPPDPAYLRVSYIGLFLFFGIMLIGLIAIIYQPDVQALSWLPLFMIGVWLFLLILFSVITYKAYLIQGYAVREKDVVFRRGVVFLSLVTVPFNRIQHCEIKEGPIERIFGLKTLQIFTAGGQSSDVSIPGLKGESAQQLKEFIIKNTGAVVHENE